jgi:hypothetical protein
MAVKPYSNQARSVGRLICHISGRLECGPQPNPSAAELAEEAVGKFCKHPRWKFLFVDHCTTNPLFVPARYGTEDACALLGCTYQWTVSEKSIATDIFNEPAFPFKEIRLRHEGIG